MKKADLFRFPLNSHPGSSIFKACAPRYLVNSSVSLTMSTFPRYCRPGSETVAPGRGFLGEKTAGSKSDKQAEYKFPTDKGILRALRKKGAGNNDFLGSRAGSGNRNLQNTSRWL